MTLYAPLRTVVLGILWFSVGCESAPQDNVEPVKDAEVSENGDVSSATDSGSDLGRKDAETVDFAMMDVAVADADIVDATQGDAMNVRDRGPDTAVTDAVIRDALIADGGAPPDDADLCPARETRPEPVLVDRFEDGSPEVEVANAGIRVIAPEGHRALAEHTLEALPACLQTIADHMGYCHPWREAIVHYGRFEPSRAKAEAGVVYIGRSEASLTRLDDPANWQGPPALCGGQGTLAHESVHTFQPAELPAWLKEGWADYFSKIVVGGTTYECGETSVCLRPPNNGGRPQPDECPNPIEYWDLSDPDWGMRPDENDDRGKGGDGQSNKDRYYKTGTCFWQAIGDAYGPDALRAIFRTMHLQPRADLPIFPFSAETNDLLMRTYFVPIVGAEVWVLVEPFGIQQVQ